eukprot:CAMPEP_0174824840 /NCGR_PEP_ID=MMETSP1107-20130205/38542_1 /TAXON_ID=36770 /ORGANISM="Paraphysomonas vestita, Strain GFlagA" /LENGTH=391 /DNA_ID=CAMNT_0016054287 /DNA_START=78 /DNA_END=1250 /DNA_ORIENTATION=+
MPDSEVLPGVVDRYSTSFRPTLSLPIPLPSLNISLSEIDNIDEDYDSLNPLPPTRTDNSSSLATTPSGTLNWDPDTPTLKAWAKRELALSRNQLEGLSGGESSEEDNVDTVGGRVSKSNCTTSLSTKEDEITINSDEDEDDNNTNSNANNSNKPRTKSNKVVSDIDSVALRTYELSKLRYYFAIAVVDSNATANHLYREVDGLELEHSSMALDLRVVPPEVSFSDRKIRDSCSKVSVDYVPPTNFVLNARQHTDVKCSWEAEDEVGHGIENVHDRIMAKRRAKTSSAASKWRDLKESDMLQYMASSDSDSDSENENDSENDNKNSNKNKIIKNNKMKKNKNQSSDSDETDEDDSDTGEKWYGSESDSSINEESNKIKRRHEISDDDNDDED